MKEIVLLILLLSTTFYSYSQNTEMNTPNNWSQSAAWSNGIPDASTNATLRGLVILQITSTVNINASCLDLDMFFASLIVNSGVTLTINGEFRATTIGDNINNGTIIMRGDLSSDVGDRVLTIDGGVTTASGLTFPNLTIE